MDHEFRLASQASGLSELLGFLERDNHVNDARWVAYMLATVKHECANQWHPVEEFDKGQGKVYGNPVTVTVSDGITYTNPYFGRGYVQLRWVTNYREMSYNLNLGDDLLVRPQRALEPSVAYRIMSFGMRNGSFTGVRLSDCISGSKCDYHDARQIVNGYDQAALIQGYAKKLETLLRASANEKPGSKGTSSYQQRIGHTPEGLRARKARQHKLSDRTNNPEKQPD
jgi:hypothetical protein